jgi:signal transduction histidine kinase
MRFSLRPGGQRSIRTRVLAIVLVPCLALVIIGGIASAVLVKRGIDTRDWARNLTTANGPAVRVLSFLQQERLESLLRLAGDTADSATLDQVRPQLDAALADLSKVGDKVSVGDSTNAFNQLFANLGAVRKGVDAGSISATDAYTFYDTLLQVIGGGLAFIVPTAKDAQTAAQISIALDAYDVVNSMTRAHATGASAVASGGFTAANLQFYGQAVTYYRVQIMVIGPRLDAHGQGQFKKLVGSAEWKRLGAVETALLTRGPKPRGAPADNRPLPESFERWQKDAQSVSDQLQAIWVDQFQSAERGAADRGQSTFVRSLLAGLGILLVAMVAFGVAIRLSNTLVRRLKRLRADTLELADERLPAVVENLRTGQPVNLATDVPDLEYGRDEVGQVADAFNKAQRTAVTAAQQEAQAREGMSAVFLNIAHRSQMVAHRQLEVLDEAERRQEDPQHLELLFRIDHLATRARRNAENLVILGGERPGRKWRNPVPLDEIARGAVSETESFARVSTVRIPEVLMDGGMVADLIHLLAELVDNATSFSPPGTRVEVRGNMVGRGVVVEIEDQGLGMTQSQRERLNAMLHEPPDFQVMALSRQMRLGLFVVAQLAARHGIRVTLAESAYGGTRAIVLIPSVPANIQPGERPEAPAAGELPALTTAQHRLYAPSRPQRATALTAGNGYLPGVPVEWAREHGYLPEGNGNGNGHGAQPEGPFLAPAPAPEPGVGIAHEAAPATAEAVVGDIETQELMPRPAPTEPTAFQWPQPEQLANPGLVRPHLNRYTPLVPDGSAPPTGNGGAGLGHGSHQPQHRLAGNGRAPLPRRRRQANLAPQLAADLGPLGADATPEAPRTPEQARDTLAAVVRGTRLGRENPPAPDQH